MNALTLLLLIAVVAVLLNQPVIAQFDEDSSFEDQEVDEQHGGYENDFDQQAGQGQPGEQQTLTLTRETLDQLLQMLSPECREQMELAIGNNGDIAMECKMEIQQGLTTLNVAPGPNQQAGMDRRKRERENQARAEAESQQAPAEPAGPVDNSAGKRAIFAIIGLVVVFFGCAVVLMVIRNKNVDHSAKPVKKLSKKKVVIVR